MEEDLKEFQFGMEEDKQYVCGLCYKQFTYNYTLRKHVREKHPAEAPPVKERKGVLCPLCTTKLNSSDFYVEHLVQVHNVTLEKEKLEFTTPEEFYDWKRGVENRQRFVQSRGGKTQLNGLSVTVYECHRSGMFISRGEGKRKLKNQGSKKINGLCPAKIKASVSDKGVVSVEFIKTHVGHDSGEEHVLLSQEEKDIIAEMIKTKAPFNEIIDNLKKRPGASKKLQTVTKKDLHNIVFSYKLKDFVQTQTKRTRKVKFDAPEDALSSNKLSENTPVDVLSESNDDDSPDVMFFTGDQSLISDNIFILGLSESAYVEELSFGKEKDKIKNEFLDMLDSLNSREQLEALKNALSPFMPSLQTPPTYHSNNNTCDLAYNFVNFLNDKSTSIKLCPYSLQ